ncbi:MAG: hypothetical protein JNL28_07570 [Planctomycetes bacterium]|nr:hypothetical protein [Planctomycetota bacterium]
MPTSVKLQEKFGDDIQVIFVECQNTSKDVYEAFAWKMRWMGNAAMWTAERPLSTTGTGLPETALIGVDGSVIMQGNPGNFGKKLEEAVNAEVKKAKSAPAGTSKELEHAWKSFLKGDIDDAIAECDKLASDDAKAAREAFVGRVTARLARVKWMTENGYIVAADKEVAALESAVKSNPELSAKVAEKKALLAAADLADEREADKAFTAFISKVAKEKPFDSPTVKKAESLANKHKDTKTAARIERFVALSKVELNK